MLIFNVLVHFRSLQRCFDGRFVASVHLNDHGRENCHRDACSKTYERKCMESSVGATHKFTSGSDVSKIVGKRRYLRNALGDSQPEGLRKSSKL